MSVPRKTCLFKNCDKNPGKTLFKFPTEKSRFYVWAQCAGLDFRGEINPEDPRFLCEKHFIANYISHQSRRKMLVHTAIPEKWKEDLVIDEGEPKKFTLTSDKKPKARKSSYGPRNSDIDQSSDSLVQNNSPKRDWTAANEDIEQLEYDDDGTADQYSIVENAEVVNQEVIFETLPPPKKQNKPLYIVVKSKKDASPKKIMNYIRPAGTQKQSTSFLITEEGNIATSVEEEVEKVKVPEKKKEAPPASLENCTEFIFNGEIYVQMPKRVFEAERDRLNAETEKYKERLLEIRDKIDEILG